MVTHPIPRLRPLTNPVTRRAGRNGTYNTHGFGTSSTGLCGCRVCITMRTDRKYTRVPSSYLLYIYICMCMNNVYVCMCVYNNSARVYLVGHGVLNARGVDIIFDTYNSVPVQSLSPSPSLISGKYRTMCFFRLPCDD